MMKTNLLVILITIFLNGVTCNSNFLLESRQHPLLGRRKLLRQKQRNGGGQHGISRICLLKKRWTVKHIQYILAPLYIKVVHRCITRAGIPRRDMLKLVLLQRLRENRSIRVDMRVLFSYTSLMKDLITSRIHIPPAYLPPLVDVGLLVGLVLAHALLWLLQRWSITVKRFVAYKRVNQPCDADSVLVIPFLHAGAREVCALHFEPGLDGAATVGDNGYDDCKHNEHEEATTTSTATNNNSHCRNNRAAHDKEDDDSAADDEWGYYYGGKKLLLHKMVTCIKNQYNSVIEKWGEMVGSESDLGWEMDEDNSSQQDVEEKSLLKDGNSCTDNDFLGSETSEVELQDATGNGKDNVDNDFVESQEGDIDENDCLYTKVVDKEVCSIRYSVHSVNKDRLYEHGNVENEDEENEDNDVDFVESEESEGVHDRMRYFEYQNRQFILCEPFHAFILGDPQFSMIELPTQMKISHYLECAAEGLGSPSDIELARLKYGPNQLSLPPKTFTKVLMEVLFTPFKLFELLTYGLQLLDVGAQQTVQSVVFMLLTSVSEANVLYSARIRMNKRSKSGIHSNRRVRVLRQGAWEDVDAENLIPGDVVSLVSGDPAKYRKWKIPADMLLLCGHAICDESSLTGESMPVPKVGIFDTVLEIGLEEANNTHLDMEGVHHSNMLLSSATLLCCRASTTTGRSKSSVDIQANTAATEPYELLFENEIKAYVVRTGFYSTEGKLMRMMQRSQDPVRLDFVEMGKVMLLLLVFATSAMVHTVRRGHMLVDPIHSSTSTKFNTFRLAVQCARILSVTVPPHIPYTISRRCTQALVRISAHGLACSEPWRIPWAGYASQILLDKTGTLTSADLAPSEYWTWNGSSTLDRNGTMSECNEPVSGTPHLAPFEMCAIISSCHSVVEYPSSSSEQSSIQCHADTGLMIGDPIEVSSLGAVNWTFNSTTDTATGQAVVMNERNESDRVLDVGEVEVLKHFPFCAKLQRMSVLGIVRQKRKASLKFGGEDNEDHHMENSSVWCLTKGSPESILPLLEPSSIPPWYEDKYKELGMGGKRTIALAYNPNIVEELAVSTLNNDDAATGSVLAMKRLVVPLSREDCEQHGSMKFGGFASFESPLRTDSTSVVSELQTKGGCNITMVTGDGPYTAVAVATAAGIIPQDMCPTLLLTVEKDSNDSTCTEVEETGGFLDHKNKDSSARQDLVWKPLQELPREEKHHEGVAISEKSEFTPFIPSRMAELSLKYSLCVTGPALRAALSSPQKNKFRENLHCIRVFSRMSPELKEEVTTLIAATGRIVLFCGDGGNDVGALKSAHLGMALLSGFGMTNTRSGGSSSHEKNSSMEEDSGAPSSSSQPPPYIQPMWCKLYDCMKGREQLERSGETPPPSFLRSLWVGVWRKNAVKAKMHKSKSLEAHAEALYGPDVATSKASLAAPFTSTKPSISACVSLIKHGKHTAALIITIYQVVILESLLTGYALSQLYVEGIRTSFTQKLLMVFGSMISVYFIEEAPKAVDSLSEHRVPESIFHPSILSSTLAQAACHIGSCEFAIHSAKRATPLLDILESQRKNGYAGRRTRFVPTLVANIMVIMSLCQRASITLCCYKGWPFTRPLVKMPGMIFYVFIMAMTSLIIVFNLSPWLNSLLDIHPWPTGSRSLQFSVLLAMVVCLAGPIAIDRNVCLRLFAPDIYRSKKELKICRWSSTT